jgi:hypothetical protein
VGADNGSLPDVALHSSLGHEIQLSAGAAVQKVEVEWAAAGHAVPVSGGAIEAANDSTESVGFEHSSEIAGRFVLEMAGPACN